MKITKFNFFTLKLFLFFVIQSCITSSFAQVLFFNVLDTNTVLLSPSQRLKFNSYHGNVGISGRQLVSIANFEASLSGNSLSIMIPNTSSGIVFNTSNAKLHNNGDIYWTGYSSDGSSFRYARYGNDISLDMYVHALDKKYLASSIAPDKLVLTTYDDWLSMEEGLGCGNDGEPDDDFDSDPDDELTATDIELRDNCDLNHIRVLVLFTANAALLDNPNTVARLLVDELNATTTASGLGVFTINFILANTIEPTGFDETFDDAEGDVNRLRNNALAQQLRDDHFADLVILLTFPVYQGIAGTAHGIKVKAQNAYCLANIDAVRNNFTGSHELGHLIGCRHQRCVNCCQNADISPVSAHGYGVGEDFRTIMHTVGCNRNRVGFWSNKTALFMGNTMGNNQNNNAKRLRKRAGKVACFRSGQPAPVSPQRFLSYIQGDHILCPSLTSPATYTAVYDSDGFTNPAFTWEISENGINGWYVPFGLINNGASCTLPDPSFLHDVFFLRITISGSNGYTEFCTMLVTIISDCELQIRSDDDQENSGRMAGKVIRPYPNPASGIIRLTGIEDNNAYSYVLTNSLGIKITAGSYPKQTGIDL